MKIISFAWTTPALLAGHKTVTRRAWQEVTARRFAAGELVAAYDRSPRFGGKRVATIRLTQAPTFESTRDAPREDWLAEGFEYLSELGVKVDGLEPHQLWRTWKLHPRHMWVVRFELVEVI